MWRLLLAFGAVPALAVFQMRRHLAETPRFLLATGQHEELQKVASGAIPAAGNRAVKPPVAKPRTAEKTSFWEGFKTLTSRRNLALRLWGASLAWFLMDFAYYGNTVSSPLVLGAISPNSTLLHKTLLQLLIFVVAAAPGYVFSAVLMDRLGRKWIQMLGFAAMAVSFAVIALIPGVDKLVVPFLIIYGVSYFFTEFGPNATTFVYPAELFPVKGRTTGHGIASAAGKLGAFVGVFLFPIFMHWRGLLTAESAAAIVSVVGIIVTLTMLPETKGKSLEELAPDDQPAARGSGHLRPATA